MIKLSIATLVLLSSFPAFAKSRTELEAISCTMVEGQPVLTFKHMNKYLNLFLKREKGSSDDKTGTVLLENDDKEARALMPASFSTLASGELRIVFKESDENAFVLLIGKDAQNNLKANLSYPASPETLKYDCQLHRN